MLTSTYTRYTTNHRYAFGMGGGLGLGGCKCIWICVEAARGLQKAVSLDPMRKATMVAEKGRKARSDRSWTVDPRAMWRPFCGPGERWGGAPEGSGRRDGAGGS